jgi:drug/metabolite transporter (DMT)-like permease
MVAHLLLLFCAAVWGSTFVATKICMVYLKPIEIVGMRFLIGLLLLGLILRLKKMPFGFNCSDARPIALGAILVALHFLVQVFALQFTSATNTAWIIAITPLVMAFLSYFVLKEALSRLAWLGVGVSSLGVLLLVSKGDLRNLSWLQSKGDWIILGTTFTWALFTIVIRNLSSRRRSLAITFVVYLPLTLFCLMYMSATDGFSRLSSMSPMAWVAIWLLGVFGTITQWFWLIGVSKVGAARAGTYLYLEPLATTALAIPLLQERFSILTLAGGLCVTAGVWLANQKSRS